jgi:hypothetical protein
MKLRSNEATTALVQVCCKVASSLASEPRLPVGNETGRHDQTPASQLFDTNYWLIPLRRCYLCVNNAPTWWPSAKTSRGNTRDEGAKGQRPTQGRAGAGQPCRNWGGRGHDCNGQLFFIIDLRWQEHIGSLRVMSR